MRNLLSTFRLPNFVSRLIRDTQGVSAVAFAICFAVLAPAALSVFDIYETSEQHGKLQDALDAATLYAAKSTATDTAGVSAIGTKALNANLQLISGATLTGSSFTLVTSSGDTKVVAQAQVTLAAYAPTAFTHKPVTVNSEVTRPGNNLEVGLVLDTTGSMAGTRIANLKTAANQLIDLVVSDQQSPYYSKIAIVPYSSSVNPGAYLNTVRGTAISGTGTNVVGQANITFTNQSNASKTFPVGNCVSERTGGQAFTDASYSAAKVGWVYNNGSENACIGQSIQPLSSDKNALKATIASLTAVNSTAGHIGLAWGWYMVSPNWASLFPTSSQPAAYGTSHLIKAVILMTDGAFNTAYCKGVIAKNSGTGSGSAANHINCNASNGDAFSQAAALCANMKAAPNNVVVYTVGFDVSSDPAAQAVLANCATDAAHVYFPADDGASLSLAFQAIAANLNKLRLSH